MAFIKVAGNTIVLIDDFTGTPRNLTAYIDTISGGVGKQVMPLDITSFADGAERILPGIEQSKEITIKGPWSTDATGNNAYFPFMVGTINTVEIAPNGTVTGNRKIIGEFMCVSYDVSLEVKAKIEYEAKFKLDGTWNATGSY